MARPLKIAPYFCNIFIQVQKETAGVSRKKVEKMEQTTGASEFKHIVRIANTDLPGKEFANYALTNIKGIGFRMATVILKRAGIPLKKKIGELTDQEIERIVDVLANIQEHTPPWMRNRTRDYETGEDLHIFSTADIEMMLREDINRLKKIRCYRGIRHETGQKVRGQRTRSNGRTGLALGVTRKKK